MKNGLYCFALLAVIAVTGCEPKLETGYTPHPLNASADERRAYYAPAFTPESHPAKSSDSTPTFGGSGH